MLSAEMLRDVGRALPWLVAEPQSEPIPTGVSLRERTELLDAHAEGLRSRYDTLYPVIDRGGHKLAVAFKELDPASIVDPEGEGAEALEKAEARFHAQRGDLSHFREALVDAGAPPDHGVFEALDRLDGPLEGMTPILDCSSSRARFRLPLQRPTPGSRIHPPPTFPIS